MANFSDYSEQAIFNHIFRTNTFSKPSVIAVALCSGVPTDANTGATIPELANNKGYVRYTLTQSDAAWNAHGTGGPGSNVSALTWPDATGDWGYVSGMAILDAAEGGSGNVLMWGALTTARIISSGDAFRFNSAQLQVTLL